MIFDWETERWTLVASVEGQISLYGNRDYHGIYVRISQNDVLSFIREFAQEHGECKKYSVSFKPYSVGG